MQAQQKNVESNTTAFKVGDAVSYVTARNTARSISFSVREGIGSVELVDSLDTSSSPWYMGEKAFLLRDPTPLPFAPLKGRLSFFDVPDELVTTNVWEVV